MNGGIMGFIGMWPEYIPGGTGPIGVGNMPGVTPEGPGPNCTINSGLVWKEKIILRKKASFVLSAYSC